MTDVLGIPVAHTEDGMTAFDLADGSQIEIFNADYPGKDHFDTGPVIGFWVDDVVAATAELALLASNSSACQGRAGSFSRSESTGSPRPN